MKTICAISTPYGNGGIAVIRVSGSEAISITDTIFKGRQALNDVPANSIRYGLLQKGEEILDEVMVSVFRNPHSYTGEDVVEIACHGSLYIQQTLLQWLINAGCQMAKAGEFTQRAFLNGQLDLTRAEAVADLIASQSKAEKDLALSQLRGGISKALQALREELLKFTSLIELELDFADHEDLEFADRSQLHQLADTIAEQLASLLNTFRTGNAIKNGIPVAIIGQPNAGKSTLLNALLGEERAIVSSIGGTTRDTVEDTLIIDGMMFRLIDTAGIRSTDDMIESLGIERSKQAINKAHIILWVIDAQQDAALSLNDFMQEEMLDVLQNKHVLKLYNKSDLITDTSSLSDGIILSAKEGDVSALKEAMVAFYREQYQPSTVMLSNARHYEALQRGHEAIQRVQQGLDEGISGEFLSMDLHDCLQAMGEVTGHITSQEVLNNIFSKFCIGK
jgi:tRNA modification GTPase